jgi:hypothetical protein
MLTIWPPSSTVKEKGVPPSTPNDPNVLLLLLNLSDRITTESQPIESATKYSLGTHLGNLNLSAMYQEKKKVEKFVLN